MTWTKTLTSSTLSDRERVLVGALAAGELLDRNVLATQDQEAYDNLHRFGLLERKWDHGARTWLGKPTASTAEAFADVRLHEVYKPCCERAVMLNCVCRYKSGCFAGHPGNGCRGSHD